MNDIVRWGDNEYLQAFIKGEKTSIFYTLIHWRLEKIG